jgi:hypothetical protein
MPTVWDEAELQRQIAEGIEESLTLEYKSAGSLSRDTDKKIELTKDVSSMANSAGGTVIYGIREYPKPKDHLPERLDPVDRTKFSKEWLEQIINQIRPRLIGVIIHPVSLSSSSNDVAYVVEIPKGHTAHQALDHKYYKRFNFQSVPMEDHEVRDVMNRRSKPDASVSFSSRLFATMGGEKQFVLLPKVKNSGDQVINNFKLIIVYPSQAANQARINLNRPDVTFSHDENRNYVIDYQSTGVLFPDEERNLGEIIQWIYSMTEAHRHQLRLQELEGNELFLSWTLYADDMGPKRGTCPINSLQDL